MNFDLEYDELASTIRGSGRDTIGAFTIVGLFNGQTIGFVKSYSDGSQRGTQWTYIGQEHVARDLTLIKGGWGKDAKQYGTFVLVGSFDSLAGQWRGNYYYCDVPTLIDAPMDIRLEMEEERVYGSGSDQWGDFTIEGTVKGRQVNATKFYETGVTWQWWGIVAARSAKVSGSWGENGQEGGTFQITKQRTGEATPIISAEVALSLMPGQGQLWRGVVERLATKVCEELGSSLIQTLVTGFTSFHPSRQLSTNSQRFFQPGL